MSDVDPADAMRDLQEARNAGQEATTALLAGRWRWALLGGAVFAGSLVFWLAGPELSAVLQWALVVVAVVAALLSRSPRWGWLTGMRARLTGTAVRKARTLELVTIVAVLVLYIALNAASRFLLQESYPFIPGAVVGLLLALAGPHFAQWWLTRSGSRG